MPNLFLLHINVCLGGGVYPLELELTGYYADAGN